MTKKKQLTRDACTDEQRRCWDALTWAFKGAHHFGGPVYAHGQGVRTTAHGGASTFDDDLLTRLVVVAHIDAVRIEIVNGGPNRLGVMAHPRKRFSDCIMTRHPTADELIATVQRMAEIAFADGGGAT